MDSDAWPEALTAVDAAGLSANLVGTSLRIPGVSPERVERLLHGIPARIRTAPATLDERFFEIVAAAKLP